MSMANNWRQAASSLLASLSGLAVQDYCHCDFGRQRNPDCISVIVEEKKSANPFQAVVGLVDGIFGNPRARKKALELMAELRRQLPAGLVAFVGTTRWLGDFKPDGVELVVGAGKSQMDIVRHARTDACNYDLSTEDLIERLSKYHASMGIDIIQAETDTIDFKILKLPSDLKALSEDLYEFCPDLVEQGCGSLDALAGQIKKEGSVCLWWD
jgi:hypothetical protein